MGEKVGEKLEEKVGEKTGDKVGESLGEIHKLNLCPTSPSQAQGVREAILPLHWVNTVVLHCQ